MSRIQLCIEIEKLEESGKDLEIAGWIEEIEFTLRVLENATTSKQKIRNNQWLNFCKKRLRTVSS